MKNYGLYIKENEVISKIKAESMEEAITIFSKIKSLNRKNLLDIFEIKEIIK